MVKKGFSLAEALIVMTIIAVLFACASKIITTRPKPKRQITPHGYYECYLDGPQLKQRYVREKVETDPINVSSCLFEPPKGVLFFNINAYGSVYYSDFQPNINNDLNISINGSGMIIRSQTDTLILESNVDALNVSSYLKVMYPESELYNNGSVRTGIIISW